MERKYVRMGNLQKGFYWSEGIVPEQGLHGDVWSRYVYFTGKTEQDQMPSSKHNPLKAFFETSHGEIRLDPREIKKAKLTTTGSPRTFYESLSTEATWLERKIREHEKE